MTSDQQVDQEPLNLNGASSTLAASEKIDAPQQAVPNGFSHEPNAVEANSSPGSLSPPPDGGIAAWFQVAGSWIIFFNTLGILNSYGQFQTIYETDLLKDRSSSDISWIGSVQFLLCYVTCIFTGPVWDGGHLQFLLITGTIISVFGLMMVSLCHAYWQFFLAQAIVVGIGFGFVFIPASGIVNQWFSTKSAFAVGVATTGSSIGESGKTSPLTNITEISQALSYTP